MEKNTVIAQEKILAIETSGKILSLALAEGQRGGQNFKLKAELYFDMGLRHSEILKDCVAFLMDHCRWKKEELTLLAVSTGPGSFTGLRVGIAFARALAQFLKIPLIGVPTFEAIAMKIRKTNPAPLCILIESIGDEFFAGFFKTGKVVPAEPYRVYRLPQLFKKIGQNSKIILADDGFLRHQKEFEKKLGKQRSVTREQNAPSAGALVELALIQAAKSKSGKNSWQKVVPFYLRPPMAIERIQKKR